MGIVCFKNNQRGERIRNVGNDPKLEPDWIESENMVQKNGNREHTGYKRG